MTSLPTSTSQEGGSELPRPTVKLLGENGNAFNIIGLCRRAAFAAGWSPRDWEPVRDKMMSGDYDNVLRVAMEYFEVV